MHPSQMGNITYDEVCEGNTGYVEVILILFDSSKVKFEELVKFFFTFHDPTELNKQGNDEGTQYASAIFFYNLEH